MKRKHIFFALGLSLVMGLGVVGAIAGNNTKVKPADAVSSEHLYFLNNTGASGNWYFYHWEGTGANTWPGTQMTKVEDSVTVSGKTGALYEIPMEDWGAATTKFIINNGNPPSWQTKDMQKSWYSSVSGNTFYYVADGGNSLAVGTYIDPADVHTYSYSVNGGAYVDMIEHEGSEVKSSGPVALSVNDVITFQKDGANYAVSGKANGKVVNTDNYHLKVIAAGSETLYLDFSSGELWAGQYSISDGYYVAGTLTNWVDTRFLIPMEETAGVFKTGAFSASENDEFKIIKLVSNAADTYYGVKDGTIYTTTGASVEYNSTSTNAKFTADGSYTVQFTESEIVGSTVPYVVEDATYVPDIPAEEGYYICGEFSSVPSWTYAGATKMTETDQDGNVAYELDFILAVGDELRVRSYFNDQTPKDRWATLGDNGYADPVTGWGELSGDNFKATKAGHFNIYAKYVKISDDPEEYQFQFFVARKADYTIQMTGVLFNGKVKDTTAELGYQSAFTGEDFIASQPNRDGYVARGVFTDEACTTPYVAHAFDANGHLYVKYTKIAWYVAGDATYSGSNELAWKVDAASIMVAPVSGDLLEGTIVIPDGTDSEHPVDVKPMSYELDGGGNPTWNGQYGGENLSMGGSYSFVTRIADDATGDEEQNRGNLRFTKAGTFAIFVNSSKQIFITEGLDAFFSNFLSQVGDVCDAQGNTNPASLAAVWAEQETAFNNLHDLGKELSDHLEKFKHYDTPANDEQRMINLYHYIVTKYGTTAFKDFIWEQTLPSSGRINLISNSVNSTTIVVMVTVMSVIAGATIAFFVLRKKKEQR